MIKVNENGEMTHYVQTILEKNGGAAGRGINHATYSNHKII